MNGQIEHKIRERAYQIWQASGRAHGRAQEHWITAERELMAMQAAIPTLPTKTEAATIAVPSAAAAVAATAKPKGKRPARKTRN